MKVGIFNMSQQKTEPKNFKWVAKRILKSQKKLGTLKGLKVNVLSLSESRKKYLKQAGLYSVLSISGGALRSIAGYKLEKRRIAKKGIKLTSEKQFKKDYIKDATVGNLVGSTLVTAGAVGLAMSKKQSVLIEAKYKYGTKLFEVCALSKEQLDNNVDKKILREVTAAVASLKTSKEWTVKESASVDYLNLAVLGETLIEDVLESQLLEDADVLAAATKAARDVSDFEDVEDEEDFLFEDEDVEDEEEVEEEACKQSEEEEADKEEDEDLTEAYVFEDEDSEFSDEEEEVEEGYLFEDEDEEAEGSNDDTEEELDEEVFFETDMFQIFK